MTRCVACNDAGSRRDTRRSVHRYALTHPLPGSEKLAVALFIEGLRTVKLGEQLVCAINQGCKGLQDISHLQVGQHEVVFQEHTLARVHPFVSGFNPEDECSYILHAKLRVKPNEVLLFQREFL